MGVASGFIRHVLACVALVIGVVGPASAGTFGVASGWDAIVHAGGPVAVDGSPFAYSYGIDSRSVIDGVSIEEFDPLRTFASFSVEQTINAGQLSGSLNTLAVSEMPQNAPQGAAAQSFGTSEIRYTDQFTIASSTLSTGSPVSLAWSYLISSAIALTGTHANDGGCANAVRAQINIRDVAASDGASVQCDADPGVYELSGVFTSAVGRDVTVDLLLGFYGRSFVPFLATASSEVEADAYFQLRMLSDGAYYTSASGNDFSAAFPQQVPEPGTMALLGGGLALGAKSVRRRRRP